MSDPTSRADASTMLGAYDAARRWLARDGSVVTATVIDTWGSAPVPVGGQMVIAGNGEFHGSVSGGCVEGDVIAAAEDVAQAGKPATLTFGVSDETAWGAGLPCGGQIEVLMEQLDRDAGALAIVEQAATAHERRQGIVIETDIATGRKTVHARGDAALPSDITARFRSGRSSLEQGPAGKAFFQAILPPARIVVIGATHIAQLFATMARLAGYEIIVVDPRTAFASPERFSDIDLRAEWPQDALPALALDAYTALVVVAHVSHIDDEALKIALDTDCLYIGALGSRRNHEKRIERLREAGYSAEAVARIKCPIGLDIGAQTPAEIAVGILAEVILAVRGPKNPDRPITAGHGL